MVMMEGLVAVIVAKIVSVELAKDLVLPILTKMLLTALQQQAMLVAGALAIIRKGKGRKDRKGEREIRVFWEDRFHSVPTRWGAAFSSITGRIKRYVDSQHCGVRNYPKYAENQVDQL